MFHLSKWLEQIKHECKCGTVWVLNEGEGEPFHVMVNGVTHAESDSSYKTLCLAKARADYMARRMCKPKVKFTARLEWQ